MTVEQRSETSEITIVSEMGIPSAVPKDGPVVHLEKVPGSAETALDEFSSDRLLWSRIRSTMRDPFAEFIGTFIILMFGDGVVAQVVLSNGQKGNYQSISWGWG